MTTLRRISLYTQAALYVAAGINHFWHSATYVAIMPPHYTHPLAWVRFTGAVEIAGGLGILAPQTRRAAAYGIIAMLVGYFDVHIYMLQHASDRFAAIPRSLLLARLPLQLVLIAWAWSASRNESKA